MCEVYNIVYVQLSLAHYHENVNTHIIGCWEQAHTHTHYERTSPPAATINSLSSSIMEKPPIPNPILDTNSILGRSVKEKTTTSSTSASVKLSLINISILNEVSNTLAGIVTG